MVRYIGTIFFPSDDPMASLLAAFGVLAMIATYLVARTADDFVPAYYMMAVAAVSFIAVLGLRETAGKRLS